MSYSNIEFSIDNGIARITLARPESANTISAAMAEELMQAAIACDGNPAVRVVVLGAKGRFFSGGGDVASFAAAGDGAAELLRGITASLHAAVSRFARMNAPLVTLVNGTAAGAGFSLAISGDLVIAAESAKFTPAYTRIGMSADGGGSFVLPRLVGPQRARQLLLLNPLCTATEARDLGLVGFVVPDAELESKGAEIARTLATGPTRAYGEVKRLLIDSHSNSLEQQLALESRSMAALAAETTDAHEGFAAFAAKRSANFTGR
ncbi:MAG: enoyl-CoA hydratase-related protein [Nevskiaceae bacterium]